jgi:hypothetical protein
LTNDNGELRAVAEDGAIANERRNRACRIVDGTDERMEYISQSTKDAPVEVERMRITWMSVDDGHWIAWVVLMTPVRALDDSQPRVVGRLDRASARNKRTSGRDNSCNDD